MGRKLFVAATVLCIIVFVFTFITFVNAFVINDSQDKINSDSQTLLEDVFSNQDHAKNLIVNENFSDVKIENGETWSRINVHLQVPSELEITSNMNLNRTLRDDFIKKRNAYFSGKINETLKDLLNKDIQLSYLSPEGFAIWVNEDGLNRVLSNSDVQTVSFSNERMNPFLNIRLPPSNFNFIWIALLLLFVLLIILVYVKKKRKHNI